jgi:Peptidase family C54
MVWSRRCKSVYTVCPSQNFEVDDRLVSQDYEPANLRVSVTGDQDGVYEDQVLALSGEGPMKPTLLLIGKRLGHDNVNPLYYRSLKVHPPSDLS